MVGMPKKLEEYKKEEGTLRIQRLKITDKFPLFFSSTVRFAACFVLCSLFDVFENSASGLRPGYAVKKHKSIDGVIIVFVWRFLPLQVFLHRRVLVD